MYVVKACRKPHSIILALTTDDYLETTGGAISHVVNGEKTLIQCGSLFLRSNEILFLPIWGT